MAAPACRATSIQGIVLIARPFYYCAEDVLVPLQSARQEEAGSEGSLEKESNPWQYP